MWDKYREDLIADFQEVYHLNIFELSLDDAPNDEQAERAYALIAGLPRTSRVIQKEYPEATWSNTEHILRLIEYDIRAVNWSGKGKKPEPIELPYQTKQVDAQIERSFENKKLVDEILNKR